MNKKQWKRKAKNANSALEMASQNAERWRVMFCRLLEEVGGTMTVEAVDGPVVDNFQTKLPGATHYFRADGTEITVPT